MTAQRFDDEIEYTNGADPTRKARFDFHQVSSGTKRVYSFPDTDVDFSSVFDARQSGCWAFRFGSAVPTVIGMPDAVALGTPVIAPAPLPLFDGPGRHFPRVRCPTTAVAGTFGGFYANFNNLVTNQALNTGYVIRQRWMRADNAAVAGARAFVGINAATTAPANIEPDTAVNSIAIAQLSTNATRYALIVSGSSAQPAVLLDAPIYINDTVSLTNGIPYEFEVVAFPNGTFTWSLMRLDTGVALTGEITGTDVTRPAPGLALCNKMWVTNNASAIEARIEPINAHYMRLARF